MQQGGNKPGSPKQQPNDILNSSSAPESQPQESMTESGVAPDNIHGPDDDNESIGHSVGSSHCPTTAATTTNKVRPRTAGTVMSSFKSLAAGLTSGVGPSQTSKQIAELANVKMERNLLERMLQERDEKISSLQKSIQVQNQHVNNLQAKMEVSERRAKQVEQRHVLQVKNLNKEKSMLKNQLEVLQKEILRINDDPIHQALRSSNSVDGASAVTPVTTDSGRSEEEEILAQIMPAGNPFNNLWYEEDGGDNNSNSNGMNENVSNGQQADAEKVQLANSAQGILLQTQLYQAMNSLQQLRQQTRAMKSDYDEIVRGLQKDLVQSMDDKAKVEAGLLSQLTLLDQSKKLVEKSLEDQLLQKNARIRRLEDRISTLDKVIADGDGDIMSYADEQLSIAASGSAGRSRSSATENTGGTLSSRVPDLKMQLHPTKDDPSTRSILQAKELETPVSFSDLFAENKKTPQRPSSALTSDAALLLKRSTSRAKTILERTASTSTKPYPATIIEKEEEVLKEGNVEEGSRASVSLDSYDSLGKRAKEEEKKISDSAAEGANLQSTAPGTLQEKPKEAPDDKDVDQKGDDSGDDDSDAMSDSDEVSNTSNIILPVKESLDKTLPLDVDESFSDDDFDLR